MMFSGFMIVFGLFSDYYFSYFLVLFIESFKFYVILFFIFLVYYNWIRGNGDFKLVDLKFLRFGIGV